ATRTDSGRAERSVDGRPPAPRPGALVGLDVQVLGFLGGSRRPAMARSSGVAMTGTLGDLFVVAASRSGGSAWVLDRGVVARLDTELAGAIARGRPARPW